MNFSMYIKIFRLEFEENFEIYVFGHFGQSAANEDDLGAVVELEGGREGEDHRKNA